MKKYISKISALFAFVAVSLMTSCSDDDNALPAANLTVELTEVGHGGTPPHAHAGEDLHLEAEIVADAKIANVVLEIHSETDASIPEITASYSDYNGLRNATFHKHIDIPATQPAGIYHLHLTVTDEAGNTKTAESELKILAAETGDGIAINITELGHGTLDAAHAHAGEELHIDGTITSVHALTTITVEIHNEEDATAPEIEQVFNGYAGQTTAAFHEHIAIPATQPAGHYHVHITATDDEGNTKTEEYHLEIE